VKGERSRVSKAYEARRGRWPDLSMLPDSGRLVYWISKIKAPLSHLMESGGQG